MTDINSVPPQEETYIVSTGGVSYAVKANSPNEAFEKGIQEFWRFNDPIGILITARPEGVPDFDSEQSWVATSSWVLHAAGLISDSEMEQMNRDTEEYIENYYSDSDE